MAKKNTTAAEQQPEAEVSLIKADFQAPAEFKFPNKEESLKIIQGKKAENAKLVIAGVDDKTGYEAVKKAMGEMKDSRIAFVNAATEAVINPVAKHLAQFKEDLEVIVTEFKAGEKDMRDKKVAIDDEKERIKEEKRLAHQRAVQQRISDLFVLGAMLDDKTYKFPYDSSLQINSLQVNDFSDEEFGEFLEDVKTAYADEQERLNFEQQLAAEKELEQQEEAQRQRELAQQNQQQATALIEKRTKLRVKELKLMGGIATPEVDSMDFTFPDNGNALVAEYSILNANDSLWEEMIREIESYVPPVEDEVLTPAAEAPATNGHVFRAGIDPYETEVETLVDEAVDVLISEALDFQRKSKPYIEIKLTGKMRVRIFPDEFTKEANDGIEAANTGVFQPRMSWLVYKL